MDKEEEKKNDEGIVLNSDNGNMELKVPPNEETSIEEAFGESITYEEISEIEDSPINEPVKVGEVSEGQSLINNDRIEENATESIDDEFGADLPEEFLQDIDGHASPPLDAPEQIVNEHEIEDEQDHTILGEGISTHHPIDQADKHAGIAADSFIGVANNVLEIGGGFFVTIKRKKNHLYFDELLERTGAKNFQKIGDRIDLQNKKNLKRIKLDAEDIALLRPVLIEVLKNRAKELTPEQQLIAVSISIAIKKGQAVMAMRAENKLFEQRLEESVEKYCERFEKLLEREEELLKKKKDEGKEEKDSKKAA